MNNLQRLTEMYDLGKKDSAITEFEEIKAEIESERNKHQEVGKYTYTAGLKVAMDLIDNHIKKLKEI